MQVAGCRLQVADGILSSGLQAELESHAFGVLQSYQSARYERMQYLEYFNRTTRLTNPDGISGSKGNIVSTMTHTRIPLSPMFEDDSKALLLSAMRNNGIEMPASDLPYQAEANEQPGAVSHDRQSRPKADSRQNQGRGLFQIF